MTKSIYYKSFNKKILDKIDKPVFKTGNLKIGYDTIIFNITSAHNCTSRKKGLCQLPSTSKCYALRDEIRYPNILLYRDRQNKYWDIVSVHQFIQDIGNIVKKNKIPIKYLRINESGDIRNKHDLIKLNFIARWLKSQYGIITYMYTARKDLLHYIKACKHIIINGSGFMATNNFKACKTLDKNDTNICKCDCTKCNKCKTLSNITINVLIH
jgi:hypothetical protein